jgi:co-chaperonin GroES (HSP10)
MRMLGSNLLVDLRERDQIGKIVLPENIREEWYRGEVILAGPKVEGVSVGDVAVFPPPWKGDWPRIEYGGKEMIILPESDIWAVE